MKRIFYLFCITVFLAGCHHEPVPLKTADVIYIETNNYHNNQNAVLAYRRYGNGTTEPLPGSPFLTNGAGIANPTQALGPEDADHQIRISEDGHYLLAVNEGSNTIAVFHIEFDGTLTPVPGSPFASGGHNPASIDVRDNYVYVVNKAQAPAGTTSTIKPNYTVFTIDADGALTSVANSTVETTPGTSPSQGLVSYDGKFVFGDDWLGFMDTPAVGTLRSFVRSNNSGKLTPVAGTPYTIPDMGGALGLWQHPYADVLYVGFPVTNKVGVYAINPTSGALTFQTSVAAGLAACWLRNSKNGNQLYVLNSGENTVSMFDTRNASSPVSLGKFTLKQSGQSYTLMGMNFTTSEPFDFEFSSDQKYLYIVNQYTNPTFNLGNYNYLHLVNIKDDGTLDETAEPIQLPVESMYRPIGCAVQRVHVFDAINPKS